MVSRLLSNERLRLLAALAVIVAAASAMPGSYAKAPLAEETFSGTRPLPQAHAHNDYYHERPLLDALELGFCSVEADVFLIDGQLLVGHDRSELTPQRSLDTLYLKPLAALVRRHGGKVYPDGPRFTLLIDFKSEGPPTYRALRELLQQYHDICTSIDHGVRNQRAVDIIISGNRPFEEIAAQAERRVMVDGRINEQTADVPVELVPLVSDRWTRFFQWRGEGPMPEQELRRLKEMIDATHAVGRRIRFWATPDDPRVWSVLVEAGVDLIGCDDLEGLASFLRNNPPRRGESTK